MYVSLQSRATDFFGGSIHQTGSLWSKSRKSGKLERGVYSLGPPILDVAGHSMVSEPGVREPRVREPRVQTTDLGFGACPAASSLALLSTVARCLDVKTV